MGKIIDWFCVWKYRLLYLPPAACEHEQREGQRGAGHGMCGGHAVLRVVEHLNFDHRRRRRTGPPDQIFRGLAEEQHPGPHHDELPAHIGIDVPHQEGEEHDEKHLIAQLGTNGEEIKEKLVLDDELLANIPSQRVPA